MIYVSIIKSKIIIFLTREESTVTIWRKKIGKNSAFEILKELQLIKVKISILRHKMKHIVENEYIDSTATFLMGTW